MMTDTDACDHHADQVSVELVELDGDYPCDWCGEDATIGLRKSKRHEIAFCDDCRTVIRILARGGISDTAGEDQ